MSTKLNCRSCRDGVNVLPRQWNISDFHIATAAGTSTIQGPYQLLIALLFETEPEGAAPTALHEAADGFARMSVHYRRCKGHQVAFKNPTMASFERGLPVETGLAPIEKGSSVPYNPRKRGMMNRERCPTSAFEVNFLCPRALFDRADAAFDSPVGLGVVSRSDLQKRGRVTVAGYLPH